MKIRGLALGLSAKSKKNGSRRLSNLPPDVRTSEVGQPLRRQDHEARVVGDQTQAAALLLRRPADPEVERGQLERTGLPADQREPDLATHRDMVKSLADDSVEPEVVVLPDQTVAAPMLLRTPGRVHRDREQINGTVFGQQHRHDRHTATSKTKWSAP